MSVEPWGLGLGAPRGDGGGARQLLSRCRRRCSAAPRAQ